MLLAGDIKEKEDIMGSEILPEEWGVQATYWAPQLWGPTPGRQVTLAGLKTSRA